MALDAANPDIAPAMAPSSGAMPTKGTSIISVGKEKGPGINVKGNGVFLVSGPFIDSDCIDTSEPGPGWMFIPLLLTSIILNASPAKRAHFFSITMLAV